MPTAAEMNNHGNDFYRSGRYAEALASYNEALRLDPRYKEAHHGKGAVLGSLGRHAEALASCNEALRLDPRFKEAHNGKGDALVSLVRYAEALAAYEEALHLDPSYKLARHGKGDALWSLGRYAEALASYNEALRLDPRYKLAHHGKGNVLRSLGHHAEALAAYEEALRLDPRFKEAHHGKGCALSDLGRPAEALTAYEETLRLDPSYKLAHHCKGAALGSLGRHAEALTAYEETLRLDPSYKLAHHGKGNALWSLERHAEALAAYEEALRLDPRFKEAHHGKGDALVGLGRHAEALTSFNEALRLDPSFKNSYRGKGDALVSSGRYAEALASYNEALRLDPSYKLAHHGKGNALRGLGRPAEALAAYEEALRLDPAYEPALKNKKELEALLGAAAAPAATLAVSVEPRVAPPTEASGGAGTPSSPAAAGGAGVSSPAATPATTIPSTATLPSYEEFLRFANACVTAPEVSEALLSNEEKRIQRLEETYIAARPQLNAYYQSLLVTLRYYFIAANVIRSGLVENKKKVSEEQYVDYALTAFDSVTGFFSFMSDSVPIVSQVAKGLNLISKQLIGITQDNRIKRLLALIPDGDIDPLIHRVARGLSLVFEAEVLSLEPKVFHPIIRWCQGWKDWLIVNDINTPEKALAYQHANQWLAYGMLGNKSFVAGLSSDEWIVVFKPDYDLATLKAKRSEIQGSASPTLTSAARAAAAGAGVAPGGSSPAASAESAEVLALRTKVLLLTEEKEGHARELEEMKKRHTEEAERVDAQIKRLEAQLRTKATAASSTRGAGEAGGGLVYASAFSADTKDGKDALAELTRLKTASALIQAQLVEIDKGLGLLGRVAHAHEEAHSAHAEIERFKSERFKFESALNTIRQIADETHGRNEHLLARRPNPFTTLFRPQISIAKELQGALAIEPKTVSGHVVLTVLTKYELAHRISIPHLRSSLETGVLTRSVSTSEVVGAAAAAAAAAVGGASRPAVAVSETMTDESSRAALFGR